MSDDDAKTKRSYMVDDEEALVLFRNLRRFTIDEYLRMREFGILGANERLELLEGYVVVKHPESARHDAAVKKLAEALGKVLKECQE